MDFYCTLLKGTNNTQFINEHVWPWIVPCVAMQSLLGTSSKTKAVWAYNLLIYKVISRHVEEFLYMLQNSRVLLDSSQCALLEI